jgi:hypothetical protein
VSILAFLVAWSLILDMQRFLPPVSPTKMKMLEPWKEMADDIIEIPDGAGLSDNTRNDLVELWTSGDDSGFHDPYTPVSIPAPLKFCPSVDFRSPSAACSFESISSYFQPLLAL